MPWGRITGGPDCGTDYETLRWGREGSDIHTERLGAIFGQVAAKFTGVGSDENLFDEGPARTDLQVAAAISDLKASLCEQPGLLGFRGSLSMRVEWQVYDPAARQVVGKFETHESGQSASNNQNGLDDLFLAAFRANARDLMSDPGFQRLLKAPAGAAPAAGAVDTRSRIVFSAAGGDSARPLPSAVQSVVLISTSEGHGSGFLISSEGYVLTNNHVVGSARSVRIRWPDGQETAGEVIRTNARRDIALVKTNAQNRAPLALHPALPAQGESVFAVGAPLDPSLQGTLTRGIVSATRVLQDQSFIQSDVAVTHGNSGGPLLNTRGEVLGVTVAGIPENGAPVGLNLFIPIGDALAALGLDPATPQKPHATALGHARRKAS